jgi:hypothetical protein
MHLDAVETGVTERLDALEQRMAALERGGPAPTRPSVSLKAGRVSMAEFAESAPEARKSAKSGGKPAGRIRLKDPSALRASTTNVASTMDDE